MPSGTNTGAAQPAPTPAVGPSPAGMPSGDELDVAPVEDEAGEGADQDPSPTAINPGSVGALPEGECPGEVAPYLGLIGWATEAGGTTGGGGAFGEVVRAQDGATIESALKAHRGKDSGLTILVSGRIAPDNSDGEKIEIKEVRNVSLIGLGDGAEFDGIGIKIFRASNVIVRNLKVHSVRIGDKDAISIEGPADHVWIDHCELYAELDGVDKDYYDGLLDAKGESEFITYSWNSLHDSWKAMLIGSSDSDTHDRRVTVHHNHFYNCNSRLPLIRASQVHVFNNYYEDVKSSAVNSRVNACARVEGNVFGEVQNPWLSAYSDELGGVDLGCNKVGEAAAFTLDGDELREPTRCTADLPYAYDEALNRTDLLPEMLMRHAGVGKLSDPTMF